MVFVFFIFASLGCSTKLKVQSEPTDAEVFVSQQYSTEKKSLGKTPLEISYAELNEKSGGPPKAGEFLVLSFEAKDFEAEKILLPAAPFGATDSNVSVRMVASKDANRAKNILDRLHNAQKFAQSSQFERAHIETDKVLEIDPNFLRALSMKGSIYYLQKQYEEALKWFEKALAADNSFEEAAKMISKIRQERK
jgi:tetratricopeptide (TPR) repeat protein